MPAAPRPMLVTTAAEREVLESWLDFHRRVVVRKVAGLTIETALVRPRCAARGGTIRTRAGRSTRRRPSTVDLDQVVPFAGAGEVSLRWIYVHMIEETARHAGHADVLRELTDGSIGVV